MSVNEEGIAFFGLCVDREPPFPYVSLVSFNFNHFIFMCGSRGYIPVFIRVWIGKLIFLFTYVRVWIEELVPCFH